MIGDKKIIRIIAAFLAFSILLSNTSVYAVDNKANSREFVNVRSESFEKEGVFVSRPVSIDLKIADIVYHNRIKSLDDYAQWLKENIVYKDAGARERFLKPEVVLRRKYGDCDDYAILNSAVLRVFGYQPKVMAFVREGARHAVCAFKQGDYYVWFDNTTLIRTEAKTLMEFCKHITENYEYFKVIEVDIEHNEWNTIYEAAQHV